jgi:hypothetical protein
MGNTASTPPPSPPPPPPPVDNNKLTQATYIILIIFIIVVLIGIIIAVYIFSPPSEVIIKSIKDATKTVSSTSPNFLTNLPWGTITPSLLGLMSLTCFIFSIAYSKSNGEFRAIPQSYQKLIEIQEAKISSAALTLTNGNSICNALINKTPAAFATIVTPTNSNIGDARTLLNWRPLTVRLAGYLNGSNGPSNGVFSPAFAIDTAVKLGARGFFFDIDYENSRPCIPTLIFRDNSGIKRSLNNGDITKCMTELSLKAFATNYDPVIVIVYLRRVPPGSTQQSKFFGSIAASLKPLLKNHLGQTDKGNFHNCISESILFTSPITEYQKKFIVITNYNTPSLPSRKNPLDSLNFWTNARIYQDPSGISSGLGSVTVSAPPAPAAVALIGHIDQLLNIGDADKAKYIAQSAGKFCIAIGSPDFAYTPTQVAKLLNILGVQCVPLDLIGLGMSANHLPTITYAQTPATNFNSLNTLNNMYNATNEKDILSFWTYTGWSMKNIDSGTVGTATAAGFQDYKEGFEEAAPVPPATPIPGFIIPNPVLPKKPSPKMNSNGGLVNIS